MVAVAVMVKVPGKETWRVTWDLSSSPMIAPLSTVMTLPDMVTSLLAAALSVKTVRLSVE